MAECRGVLDIPRPNARFRLHRGRFRLEVLQADAVMVPVSSDVTPQLVLPVTVPLAPRVGLATRGDFLAYQGSLG